MNTTGWTLPGRAQAVSESGFRTWSNVQDVLNYDTETYASSGGVPRESQLLRVDQFGFAIPLNYKIDELWVRGAFIWRHEDDSVYDLGLFFNDSAQGEPKSTGAPPELAEPVVSTFGGPLSYWGAELTPQIVNDPEFAVQLRVYRGADNAKTAAPYVCYLEVEIYFSESYNTYVRDGGIWKPGSNHVRDGGVWKPGQKTYVRDGGVWKS